MNRTILLATLLIFIQSPAVINVVVHCFIFLVYLYLFFFLCPIRRSFNQVQCYSGTVTYFVATKLTFVHKIFRNRQNNDNIVRYK